ncbi:MAG: CIA30 family protein, partial [Candidatus Methylumidiphilus sp.]
MGVQIQTPNRLVIDFRDPAQIQKWSPVNDRVMGGVSTSQATA